ncbi:MAG: PEGA domain-containing protein [Rikenellaceae bacterium]|nr:PEGA domain-containing protein [Rikenellaceae bacterium]
MKKFLAFLLTLFICLTAVAQVENSIVLDSKSFRAVQTDALTGVNIDPIGVDHSRQACARVKIKFDRMNRAQIDALVVKMRSNTDLTKQKVADYYDNVLILEMTAKPNTRFYFVSPEFGESNEVTLNLEGNREYEMLASLNQTYSIIVDSNVAGADVYLDGIFKGQTDSAMRLTVREVLIGAHTLKLTYGAVSHEQKIEVNGGSISFRQNVDTAANEPQFVVFAVEPASAVVIINNQHYTLTEGAMRVVLDSGTYNYTVTAAGYHPQSGTFTVSGAKVEKHIALKADIANVTLTAPDGAEIWINGEKRGVGSWSGNLTSGTYIFEARKAGHRTTTLSKHITSAQPQQSYTLTAPTPIVGSVMVDGTPLMAEVAIDGKSVGTTPLKISNILIGNHKVTVSKSGYAPYSQSVTVTEGKTATVNITLNKQTTPTSNSNKIFYTSTDGKVVTPYDSKAFGVKIVSNVYVNGKGTITCEGPITKFGEWAFEACETLATITIPNCVTTIENCAFSRCKGLISITIPEGVFHLGRSVFQGCEKLQTVTVPNSVTSISESLFWQCKGLVNVKLGNNTTHIDDLAFGYCESLTSITIPSSVTSFGRSPFISCTKLKDFYGKLASVDNRCIVLDGRIVSFAPAGLTDYTIPTGVTTIGEQAFDDCSLTSITIPDSVTNIEPWAFCSCKNLQAFYGRYASADNRCYIVNGVLLAFAPAGLTQYTIPNGVTTIGDGVFSDCKLNKVSIPNSVTYIGDGAFQYCYDLAYITIPNSVTYIGKGAFNYCNSLRSITIPQNVTKIGGWAFSSCPDLSSVYCKSNTPPSLGDNGVFKNNANGRRIYVPASAVSRYKTATHWSVYADTIIAE